MGAVTSKHLNKTMKTTIDVSEEVVAALFFVRLLIEAYWIGYEEMLNRIDQLFRRYCEIGSKEARIGKLLTMTFVNE